MQDHESRSLSPPQRTIWNKGKLIGAKPPLRPKHVWSIRTKLQIEGRRRDLAMFNLAIDSKLLRMDTQLSGQPYARRRQGMECAPGTGQVELSDLTG